MEICGWSGSKYHRYNVWLRYSRGGQSDTRAGGMSDGSRILVQPMYSGVLCVDTPNRRRESPIVDTQPTSADAGDSAAFDTPADVGWVQMSRRRWAMVVE